MPYYIFNQSLISDIANSFSEKTGDGFFSFTMHQKRTGTTTLPVSNLDASFILTYRQVLILEVANWAEGDLALKQTAELASEFWSVDSSAVLDYLINI